MVGFNNGLIEANNISFDNGNTQLLTDGQLIIGDSTGNPKVSTLTAGPNVTITNGNGSITIASTGSGGTSISPYIVGATNSDFTTIQAAITAAIAAGASDSNPINIYIKPGTYTENLTSQPGIRLIGLGAGASSSSNDFPPLSVIWDGTCTLSSGTMVFESIRIAYSGSGTCISSGGNLKFSYCHFYGSTGTYITTTADGKSLEFETCFLNIGTFFSSTHWVDMRFQNSYLAGSFTIGGVGNQLIIEKSTIMSGFALSSGSNVSFIFQWCDILSPILVDTSASTTAGISCELNFCKAYSTSTALLKVNKASASINNCTINGNTYFIDDTVGTGSNSYQIRNSTVSNSQAVNLGNNSNVYFYNCNLQGFGTPTLGTGATVHYIDSLSGNGNAVINSDQLSTSASDGFLHIPSCSGSPTGTPTSYGTAVPMIYDTTNDIPWFYNGSWHGGGGSGYVSITPYIVGQVGDIHAGFTTIQAAIDQIVTDGLSIANIYIKPGTYSENLTFPASITIFLMGLSAGNQTHEFSGLGAFINPDTIISGNITGTGIGSISNCQITGGTATLATGFQFVGCYINSYSITNSDSIRINFNDCRFSSSFIDSISNKYLLFQMVNCALGATITAHSGNGDSYQFDNCQFDNSSSIINAATSGIGIVINNCSVQSSTLIDCSAATTSTDLVLYNCNFGNSCTYGIRAKNNFSARITQCTTNQSMAYFIDDSAGGSNTYQIYNSVLLTSFGINSGPSSNFLIYNSYCNFPNGLTLGNNATLFFSSCNTAGSGAPTLGTGATVQYLDSLSGNGDKIINSNLLSTSATDGFLHIPSCSGSPTGTPTNYGSSIPIVYDTTTNTPWFYNAGWHGGGGSGITSLDGDSGSATGSTVNIIATPTCGSSVNFDGSSGTLTLNATDTNDNTFWGLSSGSSTAVNGPGNSGFGKQTLQSLNGSVSTGNNNSAFGYASLALCITGTGNSGFGYTTLVNCTGSSNTAIGTAAGATISTGNLNTIVGNNAFNSGTLTGSYNIGIGQNAGQNYTSSEGSNILIGSEGTAAESHTLRIGTQGSGNGQVNRAFVAGIVGVTTSNTQMVTIDSTTGQLGAATVPSGGGFTWNTVSGTSQSAAVNNGYITNNASLVTVTLPSTASVGDIVEVAGKGAGGWTITQNSGQVIHMDGVDSTTGTGGSLSSTVRYDAVRLLCITANTDWLVLSGIGNLTVV